MADPVENLTELGHRQISDLVCLFERLYFTINLYVIASSGFTDFTNADSRNLVHGKSRKMFWEFIQLQCNTYQSSADPHLV